MTPHLLKKIFFVLLLALGAMLVSCGSNSANNSAVKAGKYLQIRMHDFPIQDKEVEKVIVEVRKIEVHNSESGWMTVAKIARKYDLLELQNGRTAIILDSPLPVGAYTQIRLELSQDNEIIANNLPYPLKVPSGTESGIKLITPFDIREGKMVEVTLDFDAQKSVNYTKGDGFHLKPVIKVEKIAEYDAAGVITPEGGNVTTLDGVLNIQIPAGAVSQSIIVTAEKADISALPAPDAASQSVGIAYNLTPDGQTFNSAVLLSFHYNEEDFADKGAEDDLALYRYDETTAAWIEIPSTVLASADTVQAWVNHFSLYALFISPKPIGVTGEYNILGDSIAAGFAPPIGSGGYGWLAFFIKWNARNVEVFQDAEAGKTSGDIKKRLDGKDPDPIRDAGNYIILVGTNDNYFIDPVSAYEQNMVYIINKLLTRPRPAGKAGTPKVYVCTILPRTDYWTANYVIIERNKSLKRIVKQFADAGWPVKLIDTSYRFALFYWYYDSQLGRDWADLIMLPDRLHPSVYGYSILGKYIAQNLN